MKHNRPTVWVVEIWLNTRQRWAPCTAIALLKCEAKSVINAWSTLNPNDKFRIMKYERVQP